MDRVLSARWPRPSFERVLPWLLAMSRALVAPQAFLPGPSVPAHDDGAGGLDGAAGCEFVDDQIRHPE